MIARNSIARNSFWFGLESMVDALVSFVLSIAVARVIGPVRLGYFIYTMLLVNLAGRLSGFGPGAATRKYLAEFLAREDRGTARAVFFTMLRWHMQLAIGFAVAGWILVFTLEAPAHRLASSILVASLIAAVINIVPSQANMAAENFARNVPASMISLAVYVITVILTLTLDWGVAGLAVALLLRRTLEMLLRLLPAIRWARQLPQVPSPPHLARRLIAFSGQGLAIAVLLLVVWDRSELLFLRHFSKIQEVTFYSVASSMTQTLFLLPNVIGAAVSSRFMTGYARPGGDVSTLAAYSCRFMAILFFPMCVGLASLSDAVIRVCYGPSYVPAIPVMAIALLLVLPKVFFWLPSAALQAAERQGTMFRWMLAIATLNIALDAALIPRFGAIGAALANGVAQGVAVVALCTVAARICRFQMPWASIIATACTAGVMGLVVYFATRLMPPPAALVAGPILGLVVYLFLLRSTNAFSPADLIFARQFEARIPSRLRSGSIAFMEWMAGTPNGNLVPSQVVARNL